MTSTRTEPVSAELKSLLRGQLIQPEDGGLDVARAVWNGMINRRPAAIVRCAGVADVIAAVRYARAHELEVKARYDPTNVFRLNQNITPAVR